jgi:Carbohydrate esterase, sialic acid-specific acetylesterase
MRFLLLLAAMSAGGFAQSRDYQLFLLIGQSNMAGRGQVEAHDREPIPRVLMLNKELEWVPAIDPVHFDRPKIPGVGIARTFGRTLAAVNPSATIGLIPAAVGGTSLDEWKPGGKLYTDAVQRARAGMKAGKLRAILWHQGEGDCTDALAPTYRDRFAAFIAQLRADLDAPGVPVLVGELGEYLMQPGDRHARAREVNEQLALIPLKVPHSGFVSSAGLAHKGDGVHFDSPSAREFGRRYALAFMALDPSWTTFTVTK